MRELKTHQANINGKNRVLRVPDVNPRNLSRTESNVSLALHDTNHTGGRRRRVGLATAIATRGTRAAAENAPSFESPRYRSLFARPEVLGLSS